jgi:hypothetical protein
MVNKEASADLGSGMNLHPGESAVNMGHQPTQKAQTVPPQEVSQTVPPQSMQPGVTEQNLPQISGGRVFGESCSDILF